MLTEVQQRWVAALRSGEFEQERGWLRSKDGKYCCLGVLCELHRREFGGQWINGAYLGESCKLPAAVRKWAQLGTSTGAYSCMGRRESLAGDNDAGFSFAHIANIIESERFGLFWKS